jgi:hypothetical protein
MENLLEKIIDFVNDDELQTMTIQFSELDAKFIQYGTNLSKTITDVPNVKIYVSKNFEKDFGHRIAFSVFNLGYLDFAASVKTYNVLSAKTTNTISDFSGYDDSGQVKSIKIHSTTLCITVKEIGTNLPYISHNFRGFSNYLYSKEILDVVRNGKASDKSCYIATLAYGDIDHPKVQIFRNYRDNHLQNSFLGLSFIKVYYFASPYIVKVLKPFKPVNLLIRKILDLILDKIIIKK